MGPAPCGRAAPFITATGEMEALVQSQELGLSPHPPQQWSVTVPEAEQGRQGFQ